ncbi:flagellar protein FliS [Salmonella enterica subsp. enterica serovar Choleraesuis]|nr:flagellar protein FliS [Salmonella enterica subsp. enterica serovar Choleraesuis]
MYSQQAIQSYAQIDLESSVLNASPWQLVALLFSGAQSALKKAQLLMARGEIVGKGEALTKAISIISGGLQHGLDHSVNPALCQNLDNLYDYMVRRLLHANLHNDTAAITEVATLLETLSSAWNEINPQQETR